jgi:hypothetical protein
MKPLLPALAAAIFSTAGLCAQEPAPDQSLARMKSVLSHPPLQLSLPEPEANFKIHVKAIHPMQDIFEKPPWQLPPIVWRIPAMGPSTAFGSMPIMSLDLLAIARGVGASNRARDARAARGEVQRAIADYCAAQSNAQAIQICSTSAAIR